MSLFIESNKNIRKVQYESFHWMYEATIRNAVSPSRRKPRKRGLSNLRDESKARGRQQKRARLGMARGMSKATFKIEK